MTVTSSVKPLPEQHGPRSGIGSNEAHLIRGCSKWFRERAAFEVAAHHVYANAALLSTVCTEANFGAIIVVTISPLSLYLTLHL